MGLTLLNHKKNSLDVTSEGAALYKVANKLFSSIKEYQESVDSIKKLETGQIVVGISNSLVSLVLGPALKRFSRKYPKIKIKVKTGKTKEQLEYLNNNEIDLGIVIDDGSLKQLSSLVIKKGYFGLYGTKSSLERLLITEERPETKLLRKAFEKEVSDQVIEIESWSVIRELVKSGFGRGYLPDFMTKDLKLEDYTKEFNIRKSPYSVIAFKREGSESPLVARFLEYLKQYSP